MHDMKIVLELVGATMLVAWVIDWFTFRRERAQAKRYRAGQSRRWWADEREDGPEGDH